MDEVSLKRNVLYDVSRDTVVGVEDLGDGQAIVTAALVFIVRGSLITGNSHLDISLCTRVAHPIL